MVNSHPKWPITYILKCIWHLEIWGESRWTSVGNLSGWPRVCVEKGGWSGRNEVLKPNLCTVHCGRSLLVKLYDRQIWYQNILQTFNYTAQEIFVNPSNTEKVVHKTILLSQHMSINCLVRNVPSQPLACGSITDFILACDMRVQSQHCIQVSLDRWKLFG